MFPERKLLKTANEYQELYLNELMNIINFIKTSQMSIIKKWDTFYLVYSVLSKIPFVSKSGLLFPFW